LGTGADELYDRMLSRGRETDRKSVGRRELLAGVLGTLIGADAVVLVWWLFS